MECDENGTGSTVKDSIVVCLVCGTVVEFAPKALHATLHAKQISLHQSSFNNPKITLRRSRLSRQRLRKKKRTHRKIPSEWFYLAISPLRSRLPRSGCLRSARIKTEIFLDFHDSSVVNFLQCVAARSPGCLHFFLVAGPRIGPITIIHLKRR